MPKQYPAVPATTCAPRPAAWTSRIRPPVPVVAPANGATPNNKKYIQVTHFLYHDLLLHVNLGTVYRILDKCQIFFSIL